MPKRLSHAEASKADRHHPEGRDRGGPNRTRSRPGGAEGRLSGEIARRGFFQDQVWGPLRDTVREAYTARDYPLGYTAALDGLRGLMTLGIIVAHVRYRLVPGSILFMDVFFVMSGYFITSLLLRDMERHGGIRYGEFYRRRFARILPPFAAMLLAYLLFQWLVSPAFREAVGEAAIAFFYVENWWRALSLPGKTTYLGHTWSLAVEEQFYLFWPVTFALLVRRFGVSWRLVGGIMTIALTVWAWRIWLTSANPTHWWRFYNGLDTRMDALMVGCALAVVLRLVPPGACPKLDRVLPKLAWPFLVTSLLAAFFFIPYTNPLYYYVGIMLCGALPGAVLVTMLIRSSGTVVHRLLERPEPVFLGTIFYGMYLWHYPILVVLKEQLGLRYVMQFAIGFPLTVLLATLSYVYIERHFMRVRTRAPGHVPALAAA